MASFLDQKQNSSIIAHARDPQNVLGGSSGNKH